jgi:hypothetical protein
MHTVYWIRTSSCTSLKVQATSGKRRMLCVARDSPPVLQIEPSHHLTHGEARGYGCEKRTQGFILQAAFEPEIATLCSLYTPRAVRAAGTLTRSRLAYFTRDQKEGLSARRYNLASCLGVQAELKW